MIHPRKTLFKKIQDVLMNCTFICAFEISEDTVVDQIRRIRGANAKIIRGYPSWLYILANYMKKYGISDIQPSAVMTTGEILFPQYRKLIESQFNCKVFDGYGGENMPISFECEEHAAYHICEESVIVEFIKNGEAVAPGEVGEVIVTNLTNYAMPFIRYKIGDLSRPLDDFCSCGRGLSLMDSIEGRDTDIVITPDGRFLVGMFFFALFEEMEGVNQFQVIQESINEIKVKIVKNSRFKDSDVDFIIKEIQKSAGNNINIDIEFVDSIPLPRSGKQRFVISKISADFWG